MSALATRRMPRAPGLLLGIGLGGFVDGIVLHQILQWHHMLTSTSGNPPTTVAGLEANTLADGLFHAATWVFVAAGSTALWRAWRDGRVAPLGRLQPRRGPDRPSSPGHPPRPRRPGRAVGLGPRVPRPRRRAARRRAAAR